MATMGGVGGAPVPPRACLGEGTTREAVVEGPVAPSPSVRPAACHLPETSSGRNFGSRHLDRHFPIERGPLPQPTPGRASGGAQLVNADLLAVGGAGRAADALVHQHAA